MAHKRQPLKPLGFFEKKSVTSDKYKNVAGRLDTGLTVNKVKFITAQECAKRRSEIYYRISCRQLSELYDEYEAGEYESVREIAERRGEDSPSGPRIVTYSEMSQAVNSKPYLIIDVREPDEYRNCHLLQARNFPVAYLKRDQVPNELYQFRNKPEALIIIYCEDERISKDAAKVFVDRGADNIFLLSGGLAEFAAAYPEFVEGKVPQHLSPVKRTGLTKSALARISEEAVLALSDTAPFQTSPIPSRRMAPGTGTGRSPASVRSSRSTHRSYGGDKEDQSESGYSIKSNASVADSVISRAMSRKGRF